MAFETILVDNGSTDGSVEFVRERFPWVRLVTLAENRGFAGGNNAGVREARGEYVALLNNDTAAEPTWLRALKAGVDRARRLRPRPPRASSTWTIRRGSTAPATACCAGAARSSTITAGRWSWRGESREVFAACGCACLMPRQVFEELGGFDEDFFVSNEDVDLSYRARLRGYRVRYVADAVVRHRGSATLGHVSAFSVFHAQRNLEWMYLKNTPALDSAADAAGTPALQPRGGRLLRARRPAGHVPEGQGRGAGRPGAASCASARRFSARRAGHGGDIWPLLERRWLALKRREKAFELELARGSR